MRRLIFAIVISSVMCIFTAGESRAEDADLSKYFVLQDGNSREYSSQIKDSAAQPQNNNGEEDTASLSIKEEAPSNGKKVYSIAEKHSNLSSNNSVVFYILNDDGIYQQKIVMQDREVKGEITNEFSPELLVFPFSKKLFSGGAYNTTGSFNTYDAEGKLLGKNPIEARIEISTIENMTVLAGDFKNCIELRSTYKITSSEFNLIINRESWYAEGIGLIKRTERSEQAFSSGDSPRVIESTIELKAQ